MATNGGSGGCTTTAEASRKVYKDPNLRARLVEMCPEPYRAVYSEILSTSESLPADQITNMHNQYPISQTTSCSV